MPPLQRRRYSAAASSTGTDARDRTSVRVRDGSGLCVSVHVRSFWLKTTLAQATLSLHSCHKLLRLLILLLPPLPYHYLTTSEPLPVPGSDYF